MPCIRPQRPGSADCRLEALSLNVTAQASWVIGTILGIVAAGLIGDIKPMGLDYALAAMFIALLVGQCENRVRVVTALLSGAIATLLYLAGWQQFYVIAATVAGATLGLWVEMWTKG